MSPVEISATGARNGNSNGPVLPRMSTGRISYRQLSKLFYRLDKSYTAGLDIRTIIRRESENGSSSFRIAMGKLADDLDQGTGLADAMKNLAGYFPSLVVAIVQAGERGGRMDEAFRKLHQHFDGLVKFQVRLLGSIAWPLFELAAAVVIIGLLILLLGFIYTTNNIEPLDVFGLKLGPTGDFLLYCGIISLFAGSAFVLFRGTMKGWFGNFPMRLARRIPLLGKTIECLALSRMAWTLSMAENAGMAAGESAELSLEATQNYYYFGLIDDIKAQIAKRNEFYKAFQKTNAFPDEFLMYVQNGETTGQLAETMERVSQNLQEQAENNLKALSVIGFVMTFMFVAVLMVSVIIFMYQKFYIGPMNDALNFH